MCGTPSTNDKPTVPQTISGASVLKNNHNNNQKVVTENVVTEKVVTTKPVLFMNVDDEFMKDCVDNFTEFVNESKSQDQSNVPIQEDKFKAKPPNNDSAIGK